MVSFWHSALDAEPVRPPLGGSRSADVCIIGAGYTGLWTAYELARADPALDVVVLEAETAGFGASGRNGGWVLGALSGRREHWAERGGRAGAIAQARAIAETVDEVGRVVAAEGIDCDFVKGGSLHVAQTPLELERIVAEVEESRAWEGDDELLDAAATAARVGVAGALGGSFTPHCARVQPAKLARGLAHAAERAGVVICEGTRATRIAPGRVDTPYGMVRASRIVRATEGYTAGLPGLRRLLLPLTSSMIVTEPLGDDAWAEIGWERSETLLDGLRRYAYLQRTADGRIAIGGRGVPYRFGSSTDREGPLDPGTVAELRARLAELFPILGDVGVDGAWHGVLGVPRDWAPAVGLDPATGIAWAGGYVGEGVAAANLAGRTLRDLLLGRSTELTSLPWVGPFARRWEPEPLRFAAVHAVHGLMRAADERERSGGRPALVGRVAEAISGR
jgi:glycine/D-amino acid oxidase-like deaminating enzyme